MIRHLARKFVDYPLANEKLAEQLTRLGFAASRTVYHTPADAQIYEIVSQANDSIEPGTRQTAINNQGALCGFTGNHFTYEDTDFRTVRFGDETDDIWWDNNNPISKRAW
jgi:ATP-dependent phosphoenolpyruvate carboxykinase